MPSLQVVHPDHREPRTENSEPITQNRPRWGPRHGSAVVGKSGGLGRLDDDNVVSLCDPIAEREMGPPTQLVAVGKSGGLGRPSI